MQVVEENYLDRPTFLAAEPHPERQGEQASMPIELKGTILQVRVYV
jgi:hypothetical protein